MAAFVTHEFRCINCGKAGIPIPRSKGHQHGRMHRKKLYCPTCKCDINHVEIKSVEDLEEFMMNWETGVYHNEAQESLAACGAAGQR